MSAPRYAEGDGPMTREMLEELFAGVEFGNSVEMSCSEHSGAPVLPVYVRGTGCLRLYCSVCTQHVVPILVGDAATPEVTQ